MPKFNIESAGDNKPRMEQRMIWLNQIEPDEFNEKIYNVTGIEALADDIRLNGLLQFPLVRYMPGGKYMIISGHRRVQAIRLLAKEDPEHWNMVPVILDPERDETAAHIKLISANAVNRELSPGEIMKQTLKMHELLSQQKEKGSLPGRVRDMVAKKLNMSVGAVGEYMAINGHLVFPLQKKFFEGVISKTVAVELSKLDAAEQLDWLYKLDNGNSFTAEDVRAYRRQLEEMKVVNTEKAIDDVSDSDTQEKPQRWTLRSGYVALPEEERGKYIKNVGMYGAENIPPCQTCKIATDCSGCCNVCQNKCDMQQGCHKLAKTEDKHEEPKEVPDGNICGNAENEHDGRIEQGTQAAAEAGSQEEGYPDGAGNYHAVEHAEIENVSESDTQEKVSHDLAWYQDMMRVAVVDVAIACQKIRELDGCRACPIYICDDAGWKQCMLTKYEPNLETLYMSEARKHDEKLDELFMEQDW